MHLLHHRRERVMLGYDIHCFLRLSNSRNRVKLLSITFWCCCSVLYS